MFEKFLTRFAESLLLRLVVTAAVIIVPAGITTSWLGAAYLNAMSGVDFAGTALSIFVFGGSAAFVAGLLVLYPIERWFIRERAVSSWKWVLVRISLFMLAGIPEGFGTLVGIRANMQQYPSLVEAVYYVQAILISSVLGILYTLIERTIREVQKRESKLKLTIAEMQIQINELKRQEDVAEISSSDFFQELQQKAAQLRGAPPKPAEE